jgi:hypothetical protein
MKEVDVFFPLQQAPNKQEDYFTMLNSAGTGEALSEKGISRAEVADTIFPMCDECSLKKKSKCSGYGNVYNQPTLVATLNTEVGVVAVIGTSDVDVWEKVQNNSLPCMVSPPMATITLR